MDRPDPVIAFQQAVDTASMPIFTKLMSLNEKLLNNQNYLIVK